MTSEEQAKIVHIIGDLSEIQRELWDALTVGDTANRLWRVVVYIEENLTPLLYKTARQINGGDNDGQKEN